MPSVEEAWTDERLDDLSHRMDRGFDRVDLDIRELRSEMSTRFNAVDARFDAMQRMLLHLGGSLAVAILASAVVSHL
jgi:hypothetical protein